MLKVIRDMVMRNRVAYKDYLGEEEVTTTTLFCSGVLPDGNGQLNAGNAKVGFVVGETYDVEIDGVAKQCVAYVHDELVCVGDLSDENNAYATVYTGSSWRCFASGSYVGKTITVSQTKTETVKRYDVKKLPEELLPDGLNKRVKAAQEAAKVAKVVADGAAGDAASASDEASAAKDVANDARNIAAAARTAAETARTAAETANATATSAENEAEIAKSTAKAANSNAAAARESASSAMQKAISSDTTATSALNIASYAKNTATNIASKALVMNSSGYISASTDNMSPESYQSLMLKSKDGGHSVSFVLSEDKGLKVFVDRDGGIISSSNTGNPSTVEFHNNGGEYMYLSGMHGLIMRSHSNPNGGFLFKLTVDSTGALLITDSEGNTTPVVSDDHINSLIDTKLGVIENGTY